MSQWPMGLTLAGSVQILLPEHQPAALDGPGVKLQAEDDVAGGRAVLLVVALDLVPRGDAGGLQAGPPLPPTLRASCKRHRFPRT